MLHRQGVAKIAACAALASAAVVGAEQVSDQASVKPLYLQDSQPASQPAPPPKPLMAGLEAIGIGKPLEDAGITVGGYIEGGYTISFNPPPGNVLAGRVFDTKNERVVLDQLDLYVDRTVDYAKAAANHTIDIGAHADFIYGWDSGLIHSSGIFDSSAVAGVGKGYYTSRTKPDNQFDVNQAYVDVALPVGTGLRIRVGKFVTPIGYEVINPSGNAFYSHSYLFGFAIPFTQTGVMGEYKINDDFLVDAGITRGWNQSLRDNNGDPDFLGTVTWTPQSSDFMKKWKVIANLSEGPQTTGNNSDWWTLIDVSAIYTVNEKLTVAANIDYGDAPGATASGAAQWYGIAGYAAYVLNDYATANLRGEWYGDSKSFTLGATGGAQDVYEVTLNADLKPFPSNAIGQNLVIRPELRWDYSNKVFFNGATKHYQVTLGVDAYFLF